MMNDPFEVLYVYRCTACGHPGASLWRNSSLLEGSSAGSAGAAVAVIASAIQQCFRLLEFVNLGINRCDNFAGHHPRHDRYHAELGINTNPYRGWSSSG